MNKIKSIIKCPNCFNIFTDPVVLPCGHSLCQDHINTEDEQVVCLMCKRSHRNTSFAVNQALIDLIAAQVDSINFGFVHNDAKKACIQLEDGLAEVDQVLNDSSMLIHQFIAELKNKVELKSEQLKLFIDEETQKLVDDLDGYENECKENLNTNSFLSSLNEFKESRDTTQEALTKWLCCLDQLNYDEAQCKVIKSNCEKMHNELKQKLDAFKQTVLNNHELSKRTSVQSFVKIDIEPLFKNKEY